MSGFTCYLDYREYVKQALSYVAFTAIAPKTFAQALSVLRAKECYARGVDDQELFFYNMDDHADTKYKGANLINLSINEICDPCYFRPVLRSGATKKGKRYQGQVKHHATHSKKHSGALISDNTGIARYYDVFFLHDDRLTKHKLTLNGEDKYVWFCNGYTDSAWWFSPFRKNNKKVGDATKKHLQAGISSGQYAYNEVLRGLSLESLIGMGCHDSSENSRLKLLEIYTREMTTGNADRSAMKIKKLPTLPLVLHGRTDVREYTVSDMKRDIKCVLDKKDHVQSLAKKSIDNIMHKLGASTIRKTSDQIADEFAQKFKPFATASALQTKPFVAP